MKNYLEIFFVCRKKHRSRCRVMSCTREKIIFYHYTIECNDVQNHHHDEINQTFLIFSLPVCFALFFILSVNSITREIEDRGKNHFGFFLV